MNKKGFTIVELVIVIAVIAILAAVLIPTFTSVINKANKSKDTQLVRNLNAALSADRQAGNAHNTMQEAIDVALADGYDIRKINAAARNNEILWDSDKDEFCYYDGAKEVITYLDGTTFSNKDQFGKFWVTRDKVHADFATYYTGNEVSVTTSQSFDAGIGANLKEIEYVNTGAAKTNVIIRTVREDTDLEINAPLDTVKHYGPGALVDIKAVASASYHEFGSFEKAKIAAGRIVVEEEGNIPAVEITAKPTTQKPIKIETAKDVVVSVANTVTLANNEQLSNLEVKVENINASVVLDAAVKLDSVKINGQTASANNVTPITKVSTFEDLQAKVQDANVKYVLMTNDITATSLVNITTSTTLDGNGYTLSTSTQRNLVRLNQDVTPAAKTNVVIKNINIVNTFTGSDGARCVDTRGNLNSLTLDNVSLIADKASGWRQPLTIGGNQAEKATVTITNSTLSSGESNGYAIITYNPVDLTVTDTQITSWSAFYFKGVDGSAGSAGSTAVATNCEFNTVNNKTDESNAFGSVVFEDADIEFTAENCVFDVTTKQETQSVVLFNTEWAEGELENIVVSLKKVDINGTIANEDVAYSATNVVRIYDGSSVKNPANYLAEGSQVVKQGNLYVISIAEDD